MIFRKILSILVWFDVLLTWVLYFGLPSHILFPIAYIFKRRVWKYETYKWYQFIYWYFFVLLGKEEDNFYGPDWWREHHNIDMDNWWDRFRAAYLYTAIRNFAWEFHNFFHPKIGVKNIISQSGHLTRNGQPFDLIEFPDLKMVDIDGNFKDNTGPFLSLRYSTLGWCWNWYEIDGTLYFRGGFARHMKGDWWMEFNMGAQDQSWSDKSWYVLSSVQKFKKVYEELS